MSKVVVQTFLTLDGVYQAPGDPNEDTEGGFTHGGWQVPYFDADAGKVMDSQMPELGALLLGRKTYQIFAGYWPGAPAGDPFGMRLNSIPKYVVSRTLDKLEWNNSRLIKENIPQEIARLRQMPGKGMISVTGSGKLAQYLMQQDLVDEYELWINPIILGEGKRLFADGRQPHNLKLIDTRVMPSGVVIMNYENVAQ